MTTKHNESLGVNFSNHRETVKWYIYIYIYIYICKAMIHIVFGFFACSPKSTPESAILIPYGIGKGEFN